MYVLNGEPYKARLQSDLFFFPIFLLVMGGIFFYIGFKVGLLGYLKTKLFNRRLWKEHPWVVISAKNAVETDGTVVKIVEHKAKRDRTINRKLRFKKITALSAAMKQMDKKTILKARFFGPNLTNCATLLLPFCMRWPWADWFCQAFCRWRTLIFRRSCIQLLKMFPSWN